MILSRLVRLLISKFVPFQVKGRNVRWKPVQILNVEVTWHPPNGEIQIFDAYFIKENFEKITIVGEYSSIAATIEFVIMPSGCGYGLDMRLGSGRINPQRMQRILKGLG